MDLVLGLIIIPRWGKALNGLKYRKIIPTSKLVVVTLIKDFNMYCDHVKIQEKNLEKSDTVP